MMSKVRAAAQTVSLRCKRLALPLLCAIAALTVLPTVAMADPAEVGAASDIIDITTVISSYAVYVGTTLALVLAFKLGLRGFNTAYAFMFGRRVKGQ